MEEPSASVQPDESTGFFGNSPQFFDIFAQMHICINILCNIGLEEGEVGLIGSHFIGYHRRKKFSDAKWCIIQIT